MIGLASAFVLLVAGAMFATLWFRSRQALHVLRLRCRAVESGRAALAALFDTVPITAFRFPVGETEPTAAAGYARFLAALVTDDATRLEAARRHLQDRAIGFATEVVMRDGPTWSIEGRRAASGESILWLLDGSAAAARRARDAATGLTAELRALLDVIPMPVWRRAGDGTIVACNRAYARALSPGDDCLPPRSGLALAASLGGQEHTIDTMPSPGPRLRHVVVNGTRRLIEVTETACDSGGVIGFAVDRTDAESAQTELWRHINAHGEVLEAIHAGVAIYGADRRLKYFNTAFAVLWGIDEDWLADEPALGEILEWLRARRRIPEGSDFRADKREYLEMFTTLIEPRQEMLHLPDGRTLQLSVSPHPLGGLMFLYEDVTDHLALECSLNTLAQVQRETLDHLFEGIAVFGADGRLKLYNPAYRTIWALSEEDVGGEPHIAEIVEKMRKFADDGGDWIAARQAVIDKITAQLPTSGLVHRCDGSLLQAATVPLPDGEVLLTYLDVSDSARVEAALREKNEALKTADRLKSEFIASVSYELRTPLNVLNGFAEILNNQYFGPLNERQLAYSRGLLDSAHQLTTLINDILDLATIEAGHLMLEQDRVDVRHMLKAVAALGEERARRRGLDLKLFCAPDVGTIVADERRLKQALFNLIMNAIKFTPPGGAVCLEAENRNGNLLLSVADTGIGLTPADQTRIFRKFERGSSQSGAGLGLALVQRLIELHGGTVEIESAPERGTRILCRLPAVRIGCKRKRDRKATAAGAKPAAPDPAAALPPAEPAPRAP